MPSSPINTRVSKGKRGRGPNVAIELINGSIGLVMSSGNLAVVDKADYPKIAPYRWLESTRKNGKAYVKATVNGQEVYLHRFVTDAKSGQKVDHRSGDGRDNRRQNLRAANSIQNAQNRSFQLNKSGFKGVSKTRSGKFMAQILVERRRLYLGVYANAVDAACEYDRAAEKYFGEFSLSNAKLGLLPPAAPIQEAA